MRKDPTLARKRTIERLTAACFLTCGFLGGQSDAADRLDDNNPKQPPLTEIADTDWPIGGGSVGKPHFSPLDQINRTSVADLSLAWALPVDSPFGLSSEPIVVDGIAYISAPFSVVHAVDVRSGQRVWKFTPDVDPTISGGASWAARINRGVAVGDGLVYVGTGDCRLIAIDSGTGKAAWQRSICNSREGGVGLGITGPPSLGNGLVYIGHSGSEAGVRGSLVALDAKTGQHRWRFWTVPGYDGETENEALQKAASTWSNRRAAYGGGAVWNAITFDPITERVYFGTASRVPYLDSGSKPNGQENLYTNSILAVDATTGEYVWHYQTVPEDIWDYDATMHIVVGDLDLDGLRQRVVMTAPKNGFFYVLRAEDGKLLAADPFVRVNWATHIDLESGRPELNPEAQYYNYPDKKTRVFPGVTGAHNWHAMSFDREAGMVYLPASDQGGDYGVFEDGTAWYDATSLDRDGLPIENSGRLIAWNLLTQSIEWSVTLRKPFNGGTLLTAGGLVFLGESTGRLAAYDTSDGARLWEFQTGSSINANPVTVSLDGEQYVLQAVGQASALTMSDGATTMTEQTRGGPSMLLAFKLQGQAEVPLLARASQQVPLPPRQPKSDDLIATGEQLWKRAGCSGCHGGKVSGIGERRLRGAIPDLRYSPGTVHDQWFAVLFGARAVEGMPSYAGLLEAEQAQAIQEYVLHRAWQAYCNQPSLQADVPNTLCEATGTR